MNRTDSLKPTILALAFCLLGAASAFGAERESYQVSQARLLVDTYYGNQANFREAAALLEQAYVKDPRDANVFVQAARITVMGGALSFGRFKEGTFERYSALLDKAIELDPANPKAHILKAEVFYKVKNHGQELTSLDRAKALGTVDPWLQLGYARHYQATGDAARALGYYMEVERRGPGATPSERKAYVAALRGLTTLQVGDEDMVAKLRKYAALALKGRYPRDAWTPLGYAEDFLDRHLYDEAIFYAREALKTMNFGAGQMTLAASLHAKAAKLHAEGQSLDRLKPILDEARAFGFRKDDVLEYLVRRRGIGGSYAPLVPSLEKVLH